MVGKTRCSLCRWVGRGSAGSVWKYLEKGVSGCSSLRADQVDGPCRETRWRQPRLRH
jgi:hypothetical protein